MKALIFRETGEPKSVLELAEILLRLWPLAKRSSECCSARSTHQICTWGHDSNTIGTHTAI
jgi:hypothetical protein